MSQELDPNDLRRAPQAALLTALASGNPLALAEAYHRTVPAAHAVARRLITGADAVEDLLLNVYTQLWHTPPTEGPLEGWVRRQTWQHGADQLRERGVAPASPSAAGLLPDLPAPEVRFLDAAERAVAELPDDERRALLLAHDSGVPSDDQGDGAPDSLARALMSLAGPETSTSDRAALHEDGCDDVTGIGDWCLGVAESDAQDEVTEAIRSRPGCAAKSRAVRRGRRRIEGLPATADMGQRILVTVLTAGGQSVPQSVPPQAVAVPPVEPLLDELLPDEVAPVEAEAHETDQSESAPPDTEISDDPEADDVAADDLAADAVDIDAVDIDVFATGPGPTIAVGDDDIDDDSVDEDDADEVDTVEVDTGEVDARDDVFAPVQPEQVDDDIPVDDTADLPPLTTADSDTDPSRHMVSTDGSATVEDTVFFDDIQSDTDDRADDMAVDEQAEDATGPAQEQSWRPDPGSTAELRLSDILAEGEGDDDPFADMDGLDDDLRPVDRPGGDPYASLQHLEGAQEPAPQPRLVPLADEDDDLVDGYVEGQDDYDRTAGRRSNPMAEVLSWVLPILGGSLIGIVIAILFFGLPG